MHWKRPSDIVRRLQRVLSGKARPEMQFRDESRHGTKVATRAEVNVPDLVVARDAGISTRGLYIYIIRVWANVHPSVNARNIF